MADHKRLIKVISCTHLLTNLKTKKKIKKIYTNYIPDVPLTCVWFRNRIENKSIYTNFPFNFI